MKTLASSVLMIPFGWFGTGKAGKTAPRKISPGEAKTMLEEGAPCTLLDVRTRDEFLEGHIKGAKLIPISEITARAETELPDKNAVILVYCQSGGRSAKAAAALAGMGYTNIQNLGGITDWPYGTVRD